MKHKNYLKKLCAISMIGALLLGMLPVSYHADNIAENVGPKAGAVTESSIPVDAIHISTTHDLIELAENCIDEDYSKGKVFVLDNDLYLSGVDFRGIPTFAGTFLGQGHKIYGLKLEQDQDTIGLFRYVQKDAVVNGLILQADIQPDGGNSIVGGIAGINKGTIRNCIVTGVVSGKEMVGGIAGWNKVTGIVENCTVNGLVHGETQVGGFVGKNQGVIRECLSNAEVNTDVEHNTIGMDLESLDMDMDDIDLGISFDMDMNMSMDSLGFSESMDSATDIGGIVGSNTGVIRSCVNKGNVGYEKMSTNVGGIAGSSSGYIVDCVNYAEINGSTNVGGIAGKLKSCIVVTYTESSTPSMDSIEIEVSDDDMQSIKDMLNDLDDEDEETESESESETEPETETKPEGEPEADVEGNDEGGTPDSEEGESETESEESDWGDFELPEGTEDFGDIELPEDSDDLGDIELPEDLEDFEDLESDGYDEDQSDAAWNELSNSLGDSLEDSDITEDLDMEDTTNLSISLDGLDLGFNTEYEDVSRDDTAEDTVAKTYQCVNYGNVYASKNAGGIAGKADEGTSSDDEDDDEDSSMTAEYNQRLVIRDCTNYGTIAINNKYAGGIVGRMKIGAIFDGKNLGNLDCLSASYVGGIAGQCDGVIFTSISKCIIAGTDYVGGIAGYGYECYNSCAFVDVAAGIKYVGSIFGSTEELPSDRAEASSDEDNGPLVTNNTYYIVGENIGGIDGINYSGATKRITLEEFLAKEGLPEVFKTVSVRFVAEGQEDTMLTVPLNSSVTLDQVPVLTIEETDRYEWIFEKPVTSETLGMNEVEEVFYLSEARLTNILFDQTYEADFNPKHSVARGVDKTDDGKTRILAIGAFDSTTEVKITNILAEESSALGNKLKESWEVSISNIGVKTLRYRIPTGMDAENISIYVKEAGGKWREVEFTVVGSFLAFDFTDEDVAFGIQQHISTGVSATIIIIAVLAIGGAVLYIRKKKSTQAVDVANKE